MTAYTDRLTDPYLDSKRARGDEPADDVLRAVLERGGPEGADRTFHRLIRRFDVPLEEFPEPLPTFVREQGETFSLDPATADLAERVFRDHGRIVLLAVLHASLPAVYECRGMARLLVGTARVAHSSATHAIFSRRIAETAQYVIDVLGPGGLRSEGGAALASLRVRLIHAAIRRFSSVGGWDPTLGIPINQEELAFTLTTFGITVLDSIAVLGVRLTDAETAAWHEAWNAVGRLLGVDEDLLPPTGADARILQTRVRSRHVAGTPDGVALTRELMDFSRGKMAGERRHDGPAPLIRHLVGHETADRLRVPRVGHWWSALVPRTLHRPHGVSERPDDQESWERTSQRLARSLVNGLVSSFNDFKGHPFRVPEALLEAWAASGASHPGDVAGPAPPP